MSDSHDLNSPMQGHDYDGITELDNKLPRWWLWLFYITILYSVVYMAYYHVFSIGDSQIAQYQGELKAAQAAKAALVNARSVGSGTNTGPAAGSTTSAPAAAAIPSEPSTETAVLEKGKQVYMTNCLPCHLDKGQGLVGPNLTDNWWIHGDSFADSVRIIQEGVPAKGMITWKTVLKPSDIYAVASYLYTMRGTNPPNPKAHEPEAKEYPPKA
jgi:cytochrome c oxidase cbb3-type subunit 3